MFCFYILHLLQIQAPQKILPLIVAFAGVIIIILAITFLAFFIFSRQQQNRLVLKQKAMEEEFEKQLIKAQLEVQDNAFHQISEELHDNVGQLLSTTKMLIGITERNLKYTPDSLKTASEILGKAIQDIRSLSKSLNSEWLHQFNVVENLQREFNRLSEARHFEVQFTTNSYQLPLEPQQQVMLFRVMQEALQNAVRHANATCIGLSIVLGENNVYLTLWDNGPGFDPAVVAKNGMGIMSMKHRIKLLGGAIEWLTDVGGTTVKINLPVQKPVL